MARSFWGIDGKGKGSDGVLARKVKMATAAKRHLWNVMKLAGELREAEGPALRRPEQPGVPPHRRRGGPAALHGGPPGHGRAG